MGGRGGAMVARAWVKVGGKHGQWPILKVVASHIVGLGVIIRLASHHHSCHRSETVPRTSCARERWSLGLDAEAFSTFPAILHRTHCRPARMVTQDIDLAQANPHINFHTKPLSEKWTTFFCFMWSRAGKAEYRFASYKDIKYISQYMKSTSCLNLSIFCLNKIATQPCVSLFRI